MDITSYLLGKKSSGGGSSYDWSAIGYGYEPKILEDSYNYAKNIYDNWDATVTDRTSQFEYNYNLVYFPSVDMSNATSINRMFYYSTVKEIPDDIDFSNVTTMQEIFRGCTSLEKVYNIMPTTNCSMFYAFYGCNSLHNLNNVRISHNSSSKSVFGSVIGLKIKKLYLNTSASNPEKPFQSINNLDIEEIVNENGNTKIRKALFSSCTFTDSCMDEILKYLKTLTEQEVSYKTLKAIGFSETNCAQAILSSEWTDLQTAGWTTGYES